MNSTTAPVQYRAGRTAAMATDASTVKTLGFGFTPERGEHHFLVSLPKKDDGHAIISEHLNWDDSAARRELSLALGREDDKVRVLLPLRKWQAIADAIQTEFNQRLKKLGLPAARW
ncbi:MAG: DUF3780 domain-containing protein, partial [Rhodospirillales bacterium]|nr:DUF3780 domain-containing protein [Acetobacter sp.]